MWGWGGGVFFLMIRRPPRSTLFPYTDALPIYKLTEATGPVAQKMYAAQAEAAQGAEAGAGPSGDDTAADATDAGGDDVVDAEFEEVSDDKK